MKLQKEFKITLKDGSSVILRSPEIQDALAYTKYLKELFSTSLFIITQKDTAIFVY